MFDRGWTPVNEINAGEWILTETGDWQAVQEIYATGEWETVYNLRVEEHHTYFVGDDNWGWSLWAHNLCWGNAISNNGSDAAEVAECDRMATAYTAGDKSSIHGHHIVMKKGLSRAQQPHISLAKSILSDPDVNIDPYDITSSRDEKQAFNDALADKQAGNTLYNLVWAVNQDHSLDYAKSVAEYLQSQVAGTSGATKKAQVIYALGQITNILKFGNKFRFDPTTGPYGIP